MGHSSNKFCTIESIETCLTDPASRSWYRNGTTLAVVLLESNFHLCLITIVVAHLFRHEAATKTPPALPSTKTYNRLSSFTSSNLVFTIAIWPTTN
jgi:hypothetical protein